MGNSSRNLSNNTANSGIQIGSKFNVFYFYMKKRRIKQLNKWRIFPYYFNLLSLIIPWFLYFSPIFHPFLLCFSLISCFSSSLFSLIPFSYIDSLNPYSLLVPLFLSFISSLSLVLFLSYLFPAFLLFLFLLVLEKILRKIWKKQMFFISKARVYLKEQRFFMLGQFSFVSTL